jgi:hypothetical protein
MIIYSMHTHLSSVPLEMLASLRGWMSCLRWGDVIKHEELSPKSGATDDNRLLIEELPTRPQSDRAHRLLSPGTGALDAVLTNVHQRREFPSWQRPSQSIFDLNREHIRLAQMVGVILHELSLSQASGRLVDSVIAILGTPRSARACRPIPSLGLRGYKNG